MKWITVAGMALAMGAPALAQATVIADHADCKLTSGDRRWIEGLPGAWKLAEPEILKLPPAERPAQQFVFDAACAYTSIDGLTWTAAPHHGRIALPGGRGEDFGITSHAASARDGGTYIVMSLPSVWAADARFATLRGQLFEVFLTSVYVHEMTHTRHEGLLERTRTLNRNFGAGASSDTVQERFGGEKAFEESLNREREALFAAAFSEHEALRAAARTALSERRSRMAAWYKDSDARYAPVDEYFTAIEGVAGLAAYKWLAHPQGGKLSAEEAFREIHNNGKYWAGDEGFAIMLAVDRLVPDWVGRAFRENSPTATEMLELAVGR